MNKVGKKAWNKMISKVESMTGTELVVFHWESINKFLDFAANSGDTIEGALTSYLGELPTTYASLRGGGFKRLVRVR